MNFKELDYLKSDGFVGYKSVGELMTDHSRIPSVGGVYVFLRPSDDAPEFLEEGTGGFFKRSAPKDPNVSLQELSANWVDGTSYCVYRKSHKPKNAVECLFAIWRRKVCHTLGWTLHLAIEGFTRFNRLLESDWRKSA